MKTTSKAIVVAVALMLIAVSLFGCGPNNGKNPGPGPQQSNFKPAHTGVDLGGETYRVLNYRVPAGTVEEAWGSMGYEGKLMIERVKGIEEAYNCKIQFIGNQDWHKDWNDFHTSIQALSPNAEVAYVSPEAIIQSIENEGRYLILNDYADILELDNADVWDQNVTKGIYTVDGLTAGVLPAYSGAELVNNCIVTFFNKSLLVREGVWDTNNLYQLQNDKTWNWDKMAEIGKKVTKDTDGDGKIDQYGFLYNSQTVPGLCASNSDGGNMAGLFGVENNQAKFLGGEKPQMAVLNLLSKAGQANDKWMLGPEMKTDKPSEYHDLFVSGKYAFMIEKGIELASIASMNMADDLGIVAVPIGPDNTTGEYHMGRVYTQGWAVPTCLGEKEKGAAYMLREIAAPLYSAEEAELQTESYLTPLIGNEADIIETYNMLGANRDLIANINENPFYATGNLFPLMGSLRGQTENGETGAALVARLGTVSQNVANMYWGYVLDGAAVIKDNREAEGKVNPTAIPGY